MEKFKEAILKGDFKIAKKHLVDIPSVELEDILVELAYETDNIGVYLFLLDVISDKESAYLHGIASTVLTIGFSHVAGAYYVSFKHMLRAAELEPDDYTYKEGLLFFYGMPDQILSRTEAIAIAKEILLVDPENSSAKSLLEKTDISK